MQDVIVFANNSGGVSVCYPTGELPIDEVRQKDVPHGVECYVVPASALPEHDLDFFDAWEFDQAAIRVNIGRAREITRQRLRHERAGLLAALDAQFVRNLEDGTENTAVIAEKNRLRAITDQVDQITDLDALRNLTCKEK